jgi:hypothetical protein
MVAIGIFLTNVYRLAHSVRGPFTGQRGCTYRRKPLYPASYKRRVLSARPTEGTSKLIRTCYACHTYQLVVIWNLTTDFLHRPDTNAMRKVRGQSSGNVKNVPESGWRSAENVVNLWVRG